MAKTSILLLNGPPGSGKDTAAKFIVDTFRPIVLHEKLSAPLKQGLMKIFPYDRKMFEIFERNKNGSQPLLDGLSWRDAQIALSNHLKETYSNEILGELLAQRIMAALNVGTAASWWAVSDSGFVEEVVPLITRFGKGNVHLVKITRPGCDYTGDSRSYIDLEEFGVKAHTLENRYELDLYKIQVVELFKKISGYDPRTHV